MDYASSEESVGFNWGDADESDGSSHGESDTSRHMGRNRPRYVESDSSEQFEVNSLETLCMNAINGIEDAQVLRTVLSTSLDLSHINRVPECFMKQFIIYRMGLPSYDDYHNLACLDNKLLAVLFSFWPSECMSLADFGGPRCIETFNFEKSDITTELNSYLYAMRYNEHHSAPYVCCSTESMLHVFRQVIESLPHNLTLRSMDISQDPNQYRFLQFFLDRCDEVFKNREIKFQYTLTMGLDITHCDRNTIPDPKPYEWLNLRITNLKIRDQATRDTCFIPKSLPLKSFESLTSISVPIQKYTLDTLKELNESHLQHVNSLRMEHLSSALPDKEIDMTLVKEVLKMLPSLSHLYFRSNRTLDIDVLADIRHLTHLTLYMNACSLQDDDILKMCEMQSVHSLIYLDLGGLDDKTVWSHLPKLVSKLKNTLRVLRLKNVYMERKDILFDVCKELNKCPRYVVIDLLSQYHRRFSPYNRDECLEIKRTMLGILPRDSIVLMNFSESDSSADNSSDEAADDGADEGADEGSYVN